MAVPFLRLAFAACLLLSAAGAHAWGSRGHRLIGELAEAQLTPATRAKVHALLADEPEPSLAAVATWADDVRDTPPYAWTRRLHYVRLDDRRCRYDAARHCRDGRCVVGAIERYARRLRDRRGPRAERIEALKFVTHLVGDVHQPLHAGWRSDEGGNRFQVHLPPRRGTKPGSNLHRVWDWYLFALDDEDFEALRATLRAAPFRPAAGFEPARAARWAEASCRLTDAPGLYPDRPGRLPAGYEAAMRPLAERRVREAAGELAQLLEWALAPR